MRVLVTPDYPTLSRQAAGLIAGAINVKPDLTIGLPTGHTPVGMYEELVRRHREDGLDFSRVRTFNIDEYLGLDPAHPRNYRTYMTEHLFRHVNIHPSHTDIPRSMPDDTAQECDRYERAIQGAGGIDLLVAGVGANGHIAFNEPGSSFKSRTRVVHLTAQTIANARQYFAHESDVPNRAITIGIANILEARRIILIASGANKAKAVKHALQGPPVESVPASALQLHPDVTAVLDRDAAPYF